VLRVVIDPGVLISAVISRRGAPAELLDRWRNGEFDLVVSPNLLNELEDVLLRPKFRALASDVEVRSYVEALAAGGVAFDDPVEPPAVTSDPGDDYLVALAVAANAHAVVSGDRHLTELPDPPVPVLTPRALFDRLDRSS
jgi:putative PIN family toxin of toxin-antitoxin system